ncbi:oligosaccharide flippase family protein [Cryobacterium sp. PH31-L1]|uniref:oligosaccharide flippase family protein n=1 Tax=Cryobacterium sp. PH31-L1 TaxID=3046199 RepID=UPI0024BA617D|nr:oligosaccharide flippase family protein [Cryobacterium sp. PH31-L1]MDJ0376971.1 oligosaccharide flippase family protein [Cryobacterium sp. PH31-L1]
MSSLLRGVSVSTFSNLFPPLAGLITAPTLARDLGVIGRGEVAAGAAPLLLAISLVTLGIPEALTFFAAKKRLSRNQIWPSFGVMAVFGFSATVLLYLVAPLLSAGNEDVIKLIRISALTVVPSLFLASMRAIAIGNLRWWLVATERIVGSASRLILILSLSFANILDIQSATIALAITPLMGALAYVPMIGTKLQSESTLSFYRSLIPYGLKVWVGSLAGSLLSRLDQILILPLAGAGALGIYAVAVTVAELTMVFNSAVRDVVFSVESAESNNLRIQSAGRISTVVTGFAAAVIFALSIWLIPVFFGSAFTSSISVIGILALGIAAGNPGSVAGAGLNARQRPDLRSWSISVGLAVNVVLIVALVPALGAAGAAWATFGGNVVAGGLNLLWMKLVFDMPIWSFLGLRRQDLRVLRDVVLRTGMFRK